MIATTRISEGMRITPDLSHGKIPMAMASLHGQQLL